MKPKEELQLVNFENIASSTLQIRVKLLFENVTLSVKNKILRYEGEKLFFFSYDSTAVMYVTWD